MIYPKYSSINQSKLFEINGQNKLLKLTVKLLSVGKIRLSSSESDFLWLYHFIVNDEWLDYYVLARGKINSRTGLPQIPKNIKTKPIFFRIDSGCMPSMVFGDKTCECKEQLETTIKNLSKKDFGFIVHIPKQDGRGMGIDFKLSTLLYQEEYKTDNVIASENISDTKNIDRRNYEGVIAILKYFNLNFALIDIATNNPLKISVFINNGYKVNRSSILVKPTALTKHHLLAKKNKLNHYL